MPFFRLSDFERVGAITDANVVRPSICGDRVEVGYYSYPPGTRKPPHVHPEEQVVVVIKGRLGYRVAGEERVLGPGEAVLIPANVEHDNWSLDETVEFVSCKNLL